MKYYTLLLILFTILGCGESNYIQNNSTPESLDGFAGFRWTTPMSFIEEQLLKNSNATPIPELNTYESTHFSNVEFVENEGFDCGYYFSQKGLTKVSLSFQTTAEYVDIDFNEIFSHLVSIYGEPINLISQSTHETYPNSLIGYSWFGCDIELFLNMNNTIIINAYESHSCRKHDYTR
jgi:hypothetical protein